MRISPANGDIRTKWGAVRIRSKDSEGTALGGSRVEDQEATTIRGRTDKSDRMTLKIIHVFSFG